MTSNTLNRTLSALLALFLAGGAHALSPPPPQPQHELLPMIYQELDGDNWHRNDGWMDDEVHWCDWYGVTCGDGSEMWGYYIFEALELPNNNLSGEITEELSGLLFQSAWPGTRLDLSGNELTGALHHFPDRIGQVDLSDNRISGFLPVVTDIIGARANDQELNLSGNRLEGHVPDSWSELKLRRLELADNRLETGYHNAFFAMSEESRGWLDLAGNRFSGPLTTHIFAANLNPNELGNVGGGLRICFNDFTMPSEEVAQWVAERHAGGPDFEQCLGRERIDMDITVSGSWFNPEFDGEGVALQVLDNGAPLLYSFSFDRQGRQQWLFEVGYVGQRFHKWPWLLETRGDFGQGFRFDGDDPLMRASSRMRFDRLEGDALHVERNYYDQAACGPLDSTPPDPMMPCFPQLYADRLDYQRLTELAGTTCETRTQFQELSGAWYNPEQPGEGFIIEVMPDDRGVVYWFTYAADGSGEQAWMMGDGPIAREHLSPPRTWLSIDSLIQPIGATYGPDFDPADVERIDWGWLEIDFHDADTGHVHFESHLEDFGSGDFPIERLARPMLAECE
jgi:hypothetical protein